jgi:Zn-dependent protease/predicted transcriptional regulator
VVPRSSQVEEYAGFEVSVQNSFKIARVGGIDIFINWSWLLAFLFLTWGEGQYYDSTFKNWGAGIAYSMGALSALLLFATVLVHELSHSFTARANNLPVRTIYLFIFGGVSNLSQEPETARTELLVAVAGPLASLVISGTFFLLHAVSGGLPSEVGAVLGYLAWVNLVLALFNLIPGFPLDGGRVFRSIVWMVTKNLRKATRIATVVGSGVGYLFILGGLTEAFVLGQVASGIWLAFIGWFLHGAAGATYQQAAVDQLLTGVQVADVMDRVFTTVPPDMPIESLVYRHLLSENQRALPVADEDGAFLGLITLADVREVARPDWTLVPAERVMVPQDRVLSVGPDDSLRDAMRLMAENDVNQLPVLQNGRLVGMLDRSHVLQYLHVRKSVVKARERLGSGSPGG